MAIQEVIQSIALDRRRVLPVSSVQSGCYGIRDVALSVPTVVGRGGVVDTHEIELWPKEVQALRKSGQVLRQTVDAVLERLQAKQESNRCHGKNRSTANWPRFTPIRPAAKDFILADAKDADMAFGIGAPGKSPEMHAAKSRFRTLAEYRDRSAQIVRAGPGRHHADVGQHQRRADDSANGFFENSHVTPAARANDTSDIFVVRSGRYIHEPPGRFAPPRSITSSAATSNCEPAERDARRESGPVQRHVQQRLDDDLRALEDYQPVSPRGRSARASGISWKSSIPTRPTGSTPNRSPQFINDSIARTLAGVAAGGPAACS